MSLTPNSRSFSTPTDSSRNRNDIDEHPTLPESEEKEDSNDTTQGMSAYEQLRAIRTKRNRERLVALGLMSAPDEEEEQEEVGQGFLATAMARTSLNNSSPAAEGKRSYSNIKRSSVRKSPRFSNNSSPRSSNQGNQTSPHLTAMRTVIIDDHHNTESVVVEQQEGEDTSSTTPHQTQQQEICKGRRGSHARKERRFMRKG